MIEIEVGEGFIINGKFFELVSTWDGEDTVYYFRSTDTEDGEEYFWTNKDKAIQDLFDRMGEPSHVVKKIKVERQLRYVYSYE
jgi:hypothetical protein